METEYSSYIPLVPKENEEFFDGFGSEILTMLASLGIPSDLPNKNGNVYPSSVVNKIHNDYFAAKLDHLYLPVEALADIRAWSNFEGSNFEVVYEDNEEEEFTKVNWKEEGF